MTTNLILAAQAAQGSGSSMSFIVMMVAIFAIMWFFMIRPQQKKQKEIQKFQNSLTEGTSVVTGGGIYGIVKKIDLVANIIEVEIAKGVVIRVDKGYVFKRHGKYSSTRQINEKAARHIPDSQEFLIQYCE